MSDTPFRASGFGVVTAEICKRLGDLGNEIMMLGWWSRTAATYSGLPVEPCPTCPKAASAAIVRLTADFRPDYLITLSDIPWISYLADDKVRDALSRGGVRWCIYYPVDGVLPNGGLPTGWVRVLSKADAAVTMSEFGEAASARSGIVSTMIPHGCDTELFRPPANKETAKRRLGYDGKFVILSDARNHRRKLIPRALDIVRRLNIPASKLVFHLHTNSEPLEDAEAYRYNVRADLDLLRVRFATGLRNSASRSDLSMLELANLYSAADVHLLTSFGEGFGLSTLQAASSGVVPIAPANSASTELVSNHGFAISCDSSTVDEFGLIREFIDRGRAVSVLQDLYRDPDLLRARSAAARSFALDYSWDRVVQRWDAFLNGCRQTPPLTQLRSHRAWEQSCQHFPQPAAALGTPKSFRLRPSGHEQSVLPLPWIGVPTRLDHNNKAGENPQTLVLADPSCASELLPLERLFPGIRVLKIPIPSSFGRKDLYNSTEGAMLVVDPENRLRPGLDFICALRGVSFIGKSKLWPPVRGGRLLLRARLVLTDYAFSERRLWMARERARNAIGAAIQRSQDHWFSADGIWHHTTIPAETDGALSAARGSQENCNPECP